MYSIMPGSVVSPYSELAMRYVHLGKSPPRPAATWPLRHSGGETIFFGSVMPCWVSALAMFTQAFEVTLAMTMSAEAAPVDASTPVRSVAVGGHGPIFTEMPTDSSAFWST